MSSPQRTKLGLLSMDSPGLHKHRFIDITQMPSQYSALYLSVWRDGHFPIRRQTVTRRPTGECAQEISVPSQCWVVEDPVFELLLAPQTVMIRRENYNCTRDLIHRFTGHQQDFQTSHQSDTGDELFDEHGDAKLLHPSYPNPFNAEALRQTGRWLSAGVKVSGQPGIGKSAQLILILVLRLHAKLPTIWQDSPTHFYAFTQKGVFQVSLYLAGPSDLREMADYFPKYTWILFDSNQNNLAPATAATGLFIVQAASPLLECFDWAGKKRASFWYMVPFNTQELIMANSFQDQPQGENKLVEFSEKYAPSDREAYESAGLITDYNDQVIEVLRSLSFDTLYKVLTDASANHLPEPISQSFVRLDPNWKRGPLVSIPSRYLLDQIDILVIKGDTNRRRELYGLFLQPPFSKTTAGWILASTFHRTLLHTGQWPVQTLSRRFGNSLVHWRSHLPPAPIPQYMVFNSGVRPACETTSRPLEVPIDLYDAKDDTLSLRGSLCYYQPIWRDQANFDGFLWSGDGLAIVFQTAVGDHDNHTVKKSGFD